MVQVIEVCNLWMGIPKAIQPAFYPDKNRKAFIKNKQNKIKLVISSGFVISVPQMDSNLLKTIPFVKLSGLAFWAAIGEWGGQRRLETQT